MAKSIHEGCLENQNFHGIGGAHIAVKSINNKANREADDLSKIFTNPNKKVLFLIDNAVIHTQNTKNLINCFGGIDPIVIPLHSGEHLKNITFINSIIERISQKFTSPPDTIFAVGGGTIINTVNALVPLLSIKFENIDWESRPLITPEMVKTSNYIIVPTTVLSIADVAFGSKGNINTEYQKHKFKLYYNPQAIFLDPCYVNMLPTSEIKNGLIECLKHAILQDNGLSKCVPSFQEVLKFLKSSFLNRKKVYRIAFQTMCAKSKVINIDDREQYGGGFLLSYGHLHAHAYEVVSAYKISHGESVLLGMLIDLKLVGSEKIYRELLKVSAFHSLIDKIDLLKSLDSFQLRDAYQREPKAFFRAENEKYQCLSVSQIGLYGTELPCSRDIRSFEWQAILDAQQEVLQEILETANRL